MSRKKCTGCGVVKDYAEFTRSKITGDGLQYRCKSCRRRHYKENREASIEYSRRYRDENMDSEIERSRRYYEDNREAVLDYKRRYREEHREVLNEIERRRRKKINDATREIATRNGEPWTPAEDAYIMSADESSAIMAMELGRTINSVDQRAARLRRKTAA